MAAIECYKCGWFNWYNTERCENVIRNGTGCQWVSIDSTKELKEEERIGSRSW